MTDESISREFRLKNINETRNYYIEEISLNEMMSKRHEIVCRVFNCVKNLLISVSTETGYVSISDFASLIGVPVGIVGSTIGLQIFVLTAAIKKYKTIIKKRKHDKIVSLANSKLNSIEVFIRL